MLAASRACAGVIDLDSAAATAPASKALLFWFIMPMLILRSGGAPIIIAALPLTTASSPAVPGCAAGAGCLVAWTATWLLFWIHAGTSKWFSIVAIRKWFWGFSIS